MKKLSNCIWFDRQGEEAAKFYTSVFGGKILRTNYYTDEGHEIHGMPKGTAMVVEFEIMGQTYLALNGGPIFPQSESFSVVVNCENQREIDQYWEKLQEGGGKPSQCGWLKDRFGLSWQVVPTQLAEMMSDQDPEKVRRVTHAFLQMTKFDLEALRRAYEGK